MKTKLFSLLTFLLVLLVAVKVVTTVMSQNELIHLVVAAPNLKSQSQWYLWLLLQRQVAILMLLSR